MHTVYHGRPMQPADILPAFAVVQCVCSSIAFAQWRNHADTILARAREAPHTCGAEVLTGFDGYIYALFTFQVMLDLRNGASLVVRDFCVTALTSRSTPAQAFMRHATELGRRLDCRRLSIDFLDPNTWRESRAPHETMQLGECRIETFPTVTKVISS